jgi:hypothetical protein
LRKIKIKRNEGGGGMMSCECLVIMDLDVKSFAMRVWSIPNSLQAVATVPMLATSHWSLLPGEGEGERKGEGEGKGKEKEKKKVSEREQEKERERERGRKMTSGFEFDVSDMQNCRDNIKDSIIFIS